ncbi:anti-sigma factor domain-containing protein [Caldisalinibacter kiritimatiensis]|uniref:RsgI N-terminal anti-sigma domain-containing protein n=1 Tax=Caldisalinibacter kiritimatiensis TaxID=1304284 RepID=R1ARH3_9FIRM|nr:anti-sigma factor domain-containing protein [Caldisalinibacter kiritimatiensis]EOC99752.1 hypothetical protein L21TH_2230 [Caldisalinibacter kiritimatiensis]
MKGIVMEKLGDKVVVLTKEGDFIETTIPNEHVDIGQEIIIDNRSSNSNLFRRVVSIAAAIILLVIGSYGVYGYYNPFGYVNVDINPSLEIAYNLYGRVIDIKPLNDDGKLIASKLDDFKNKSVDDVLNQVVDKAVEEEFIEKDKENLVLVTITEKGKKIKEENIQQQVNNHIEEIKMNTELVIVESDKETYEKAKKEKTSPGKLMLINEALKLDKSIKTEEIFNKPVKEIVNIINEKRKEIKDKVKDRKKEEKEEKLDKLNGTSKTNKSKEKAKIKEKIRIEEEKENKKDKSEGNKKEKDNNSKKPDEQKDKKDRKGKSDKSNNVDNKEQKGENEKKIKDKNEGKKGKKSKDERDIKNEDNDKNEDDEDDDKDVENEDDEEYDDDNYDEKENEHEDKNEGRGKKRGKEQRLKQKNEDNNSEERLNRNKRPGVKH